MAGAEEVAVAWKPGDGRDRMGCAVEEPGVIDVAANVEAGVVLVAAEVEDLPGAEQRRVNGEDAGRVAAPIWRQRPRNSCTTTGLLGLDTWSQSR